MLDIGNGRSIAAMRADELGTLEQWAAQEQWNPGLADLAVAWEVDPDAFVAVRQDGELIAGGTIMSYGGRFGFMGLFIVRSDLRGEGLGTALWTYRRDRLIGRLAPGSTIGMDGVFGMVPFYERGGFSLAYRDLRFEGSACGVRDEAVVDLRDVPFDTVDQYDRLHVPAPRREFLQKWIAQPGARGGVLLEHGRPAAYGMVRPCRVGFKVGPLFADTADLADRLLGHLLSLIDGAQVQLDVPEPNEAGTGLAQRYGLAESFGCARMYLGPDPKLPLQRIFGVTSFEFG